jgi:photosystem II stability/assembly factor-like uncharacterized protein
MNVSRKLRRTCARSFLLASLAAVVAALVGAGCHREVEMSPLIDRKIAITDRFYDVEALGPERALVVGYGGKILETQDGGATWTRVSSGTGDHALYNLTFVDGTEGWIVGQDGLILHTSDGGKTWQRQTSDTDRYLFSVMALDRQRVYAVGDRSTFTMSTDGGHTWKAQLVKAVGDDMTRGVSAAAQDPVFYDVHFLNASEGWISGEFGKLLQTTDGGATWTERQASLMGEEFFDPLDLPTLFGLSFLSREVAVAAGLDARLAHTADGGLRWGWETIESSYPLLDPFFDVHLFADGSGWAIGAAGQVVRRAAGETTWRTADLGQPIFTWLRGMSFLDQKNGWLVGGYGLILHTTDGGETWLPCFG